MAKKIEALAVWMGLDPSDNGEEGEIYLEMDAYGGTWMRRLTERLSVCLDFFASLDDAWMLVRQVNDDKRLDFTIGCATRDRACNALDIHDHLEELRLMRMSTFSEAATAICECIGVAARLWKEGE